MNYEYVITGTFLERPNRFIAKVRIDQDIVTVHVKNTGRCKEILVPGAKVVLSASDSPNRKTPYDLVAAYKGDLLINIDSQAPNAAFKDYIASSSCFGSSPQIYPEKVHGDSRFDFYVESNGRKIFAEVKGVTLEKDGVCMFPDAPTERGLKHLRGLEECVKEGYEAYLVMIVQMKGMKRFVPNYSTHREFGEAMEHAERSGVGVMVLECDVTEDSMTVNGRPIPHSYLRSLAAQRLPDALLGDLGRAGGVHHQDGALRQVLPEELLPHRAAPLVDDELVRVAEVVGRKVL